MKITQAMLADKLNCDERTVRAKLSASQGFSPSDMKNIDSLFGFKAGFALHISRCGADIAKPANVITCSFTGAETGIATLFVETIHKYTATPPEGSITVIDRYLGSVSSFDCKYTATINDGYIRTIIATTNCGRALDVGGYNACIERYALQTMIVRLGDISAEYAKHIFADVPVFSSILSDVRPNIHVKNNEFNNKVSSIHSGQGSAYIYEFIDMVLCEEVSSKVHEEIAISAIRRSAYNHNYDGISETIADMLFNMLVDENHNAQDRFPKLMELATAFGLKRRNSASKLADIVNVIIHKKNNTSNSDLVSIAATAIQLRRAHGIALRNVDTLMSRIKSDESCIDSSTLASLIEYYLSMV